MSRECNVRTVTCFLPDDSDKFSLSAFQERVQRASAFLKEAQVRLEDTGVVVQTTRISTRILNSQTNPSWILKHAKRIEDIVLENGIKFLNLGCITHPSFLESDTIPELVTSLTITSLSIDWQPNWDWNEALLLARVIFEIGKRNPDANFRFGVSFNCSSGIPYFPASYAGCSKEGQPSFALGTENSALLWASRQGQEGKSESLAAIRSSLFRIFMEKMRPLEEVCLGLEKTQHVRYLGIDSSLAPNLRGEEHDVARALKLHDIDDDSPPFGMGTAAVINAVTDVLKRLDLRLCGYCGVMLPVLENESLAKSATTADLTIDKLMLYANLCGVGLDTVPIAAPSIYTSSQEVMDMERRLASLLLDVAAISNKQHKPLTARLLPVPGAQNNEGTNFRSEYLINGTVMKY